MILKNIKGFMIDLDGVVYHGNNPLEGAVETVNFLMRNYKCLFVTNTTRIIRKDLAKKLRSFGILAKDDNIITALSATIDYIKSIKKHAKCYVIGSNESKNEFAKNGLQLDAKNPDFVVIGLDKNINFEILNKAFRLILDGANFVAMHEDRFAPIEDGLILSVGPFVRALEYATGQKAVCIGKPNTNLFKIALTKLKTKPKETAMIGDRIESDILGAKNIGMKGILVKKEYSVDKTSKTKPDLALNSIAELLSALKWYFMTR